MSKRIILYGLAFGSLASAAFFIYFSKEIYLGESLFAQLFFFFSFILSTMAAVFLSTLSIYRDTKGTATLPQLIFNGLILGAVISLIVSVMHSYVLYAHPSFIEKYFSFMEQRNLALMEANGQLEEAKEQMEGFRNAFTSKIKYFFQQFSIASSISMVVSALTGYVLTKLKK